MSIPTIGVSGTYWTPALTTQALVQTGNYTANANQIVPVSTASGNVTVTLPNAPMAGTIVGVKMVTQGGSNTVTVATQSADVINKAGGGTSLTLKLLNQGVLLQYGAGIWMTLSDDLPLSQLDSRYLQGTYPESTSEFLRGDGTWQIPSSGVATATAGLETTTSTVVVSGAAAPTAGQALTATSGTAAAWETFPGLQRSGDTSGTTDTANIQALMNSANGAYIQLGPGTFYLNQLTPPAGQSGGLKGAGISATTLEFNTSTAGLYFGNNTGSQQYRLFELALTQVGTGDLLGVNSGYRFPQLLCSWTGFQVNNTGGSCINATTSTSSVMSQCYFDRCTFGSNSATRTVPLITASTPTGGGISNSTWTNCAFSPSDAEQYTIYLACTGTYGAHYDMVFRNCRWEAPYGGIIQSLSGNNLTLDNCMVWDLNVNTVENSLIYIGEYSGGAPSIGTRITNYGRNLKGPDGSVTWDIYLDATCLQTYISGATNKGSTASGPTDLYFNFSGCADVTLVSNLAPNSENGSSTVVITNPSPSQVVIGNGNVTTAGNVTVGGNLVVDGTADFSGSVAVSGQFLATPSMYAPVTQTVLAAQGTTMVPFTLSTTVAAGSTGGEISAIASWSSPSAGVLDTGTLPSGWPSSGTVYVAASGSTVAVVTYTGTSGGNSLTGCAYVSGSATGTVATAGTVSLDASTGPVATGSFTAPVSGSVVVEAAFVGQLSAANADFAIGLLGAGTSTVYGNNIAYLDTSAGARRAYTLKWLVTTLTSGDSYNLQLAGCAAAGDTLAIYAYGLSSTTPSLSTGGQGAPAYMFVQEV